VISNKPWPAVVTVNAAVITVSIRLV